MQRIIPSAEGPARRKDTTQDTEALIYNKNGGGHLRPSELANGTTGHIGYDEGPCMEHFYDAFDEPVSGEINEDHTTSKTICQSFQPKSREGVIESMTRVRKEAEQFARIACRGRRLSNYKQRKANHHILESIAASHPGFASKHGRTNSASLAETRGGEPGSKTRRSLSDPLTAARHIIHPSVRATNHNKPGRMASNIAPKHLVTRARGSQSDNSFLLKRSRDHFLRKRRTNSEPVSRNRLSSRLGKVTVGSGSLVLPRKQSLTAFKKALPSSSGNTRAHFVNSLSRRTSEAQDVILLDKKRMDPPNHFSVPRSSLRLAQKRKEAGSPQRATESFQKKGSKKRQKSDELCQNGSNISQRLRSSMRHTTGVETQKPPTARGTSSRSRPISAPGGDIVADEAKKERLVRIPADLDMATELRKYSQWPDDSGALVTAQGCLLPAKYNFSGIPGFDWICPVRSCRRCFQSQKGLASHFGASHNSCLLNDNRDGTFIITGHYTSSQHSKRRPALVKSKKPFPLKTPPLMNPRGPATGFSVQQQFTASQEKANALAAPNSSEMTTVDEMMLHSAFRAISSAETSGASEVSELSRTPSLQDTHHSSESRAATSSRTSSPGDTKSDEESTARSPAYGNSRRDATKENWRLVRKFLTGRQFSLPKRGYFAAVLSTPRRRDVILRPGRRFVADQPKSVRILMVHMTGEEPNLPCNSCDQGRGPFKRCVAICKAAAGETTNGIVCCTNCATKKGLPHRCNVEVVLSRAPTVQQRKPHKERPIPEARQEPSLSGTRVTKVDDRFTLTVHTLPVDGSIDLDVAPESVRLCSVAVGKVTVDLESNEAPFLLGTHGMFKLMPKAAAQVSNASGSESVLHISTLRS